MTVQSRYLQKKMRDNQSRSVFESTAHLFVEEAALELPDLLLEEFGAPFS